MGMGLIMPRCLNGIGLCGNNHKCSQYHTYSLIEQREHWNCNCNMGFIELKSKRNMSLFKCLACELVTKTP